MSKKELRIRYKELRKNEKSVSKDDIIYEKVIHLDKFQNANTVLCYVSLNDEISTEKIIEYSLGHHKTVAVPYCLDTNGNMEFYIIHSLNELATGSFGVREPDIRSSKRLENFDASIIIVPGICFDKNGYRLGYGKGFYDRFLSRHHIFSIGLCFDNLLQSDLPVNEYDKAVDIIVTENNILYCNNGGKNG